MNKQTHSILIFGAFVAVTAHAGGTPRCEFGEEASLRDFVAYAVRHNPGVKSAFALWQAELEQIAQAKSLPDPRFSYATYLESVETRVGPQEQKFEISQAIPWFGTTRLRRDAAVQAAEAAFQRYEAARRMLVRDVKRACLEYYYLRRADELNIAHHNVYVSHERAVESRFLAGMPLSKLNDLQIEHDQLMDRLYALREQIPVAAARLNAVLDRPADAKLPNLAVSEPGDDTRLSAQAAAQLTHGHPVLLELDALLAREEAHIRLAEKGRAPSFRLSAQYIRTGEALDRNVADSGKDPIIAGIGIELPVWREAVRARENEAHFRKASLAERRVEQANKLEAHTHSAVVDRVDAERRVRLYRDQLLPGAQHAREAVLAQYRTGRTQIAMVLHAEHRILEFEMAYERALADHGIAIAEIEMFAGLPFDPGASAGHVDEADGGQE